MAVQSAILATVWLHVS